MQTQVGEGCPYSSAHDSYECFCVCTGIPTSERVAKKSLSIQQLSPDEIKEMRIASRVSVCVDNKCFKVTD